MTAYQQLTSRYIRAWCEEWALSAAAVEQALTTYAQVENETEVIACLCGLARAQQDRLRRANRLTTPTAVIENRNEWPVETDTNWNEYSDDYQSRLF